MGNPAVVEAVDKEYILEISYSMSIYLQCTYDMHTNRKLTLPHPSGENQRSLDVVNVSIKSSVR